MYPALLKVKGQSTCICLLLQNVFVCCYRMALEEIRHDMQERQHRWQTIENFCGFLIKTNPGLPKIQAALYGEGGKLDDAKKTKTIFYDN